MSTRAVAGIFLPRLRPGLDYTVGWMMFDADYYRKMLDSPSTAKWEPVLAEFAKRGWEAREFALVVQDDANYLKWYNFGKMTDADFSWIKLSRFGDLCYATDGMGGDCSRSAEGLYEIAEAHGWRKFHVEDADLILYPPREDVMNCFFGID